MFSPRSLIAAAASVAVTAGALFVAGGAYAMEPIVIASTPEGVRTATVDTSGYNLADKAQRADFEGRLKRVSGMVCSETGRDVRSLQRAISCENEAFEGAVAQLDRRLAANQWAEVTISVSGN